MHTPFCFCIQCLVKLVQRNCTREIKKYLI